MTPSEATGLMALVDIVPKRLPFHWRNVSTDPAGRACVEVMTTASTVTLQAWFDKAGCCVTRMERAGNARIYSVWFDFN